MRSGETALDAANQGIFPIWTQSPLVHPLLKYTSKTQASLWPLETAGLDCQLTSGNSPKTIGRDIVAFLRRYDPSLLQNGREEVLIDVPPMLAGEYKPAETDRDATRKALTHIYERLDPSKPHDFVTQGDISLWRQILENLMVFEEMVAKPNADSSARDRQMGKNLVWLANERYRGRKIIVWAASFHNAFNIQQIEYPGIDYTKVETMGNVARGALGKDIYSIGFLAAEGEMGNPFRNPTPLEKAAEGSLDLLFSTAGPPFMFLDMRSLPASNPLARLQVARPLGYAPMKAVWPNVFDGFFFTKTMFSAHALSAVPKGTHTGVTVLDPVVAEVGPYLEKMRINAITYKLGFDSVLDQVQALPSSDRVKLFPAGGWPKLTAIINVLDADQFVVVKHGQSNYRPNSEAGYFFREPVEGIVSPDNYQTLILAKGLSKGGIIRSDTYTVVGCFGDAEGDMNFSSYADLLVIGDLRGIVQSGSYFSGLVRGDLSGSFSTANSCTLYVDGRVTGTVNLGASSAKFYIGGRMTQADLSRITGNGKVTLRDSDLAEGTHKVGQLTVIVKK